MEVTSSRHIYATDAQGQLVYSNLPDACRGCPEVSQALEVTIRCGLGGKRRRGKVATADGVAFICTNDPDLIASSRLFKKELELFSLTLARMEYIKAELQKTEAHKTRRLLHNLISLNAHSLQELYSVIPQDQLSNLGGFKDQKALVTKHLHQRPGDAAEIFLRALKNAGAVKNELAVFSKLHEASPVLDTKRHAIHRVILNVANYFFQDFADQQVELLLRPCQAKVAFDYESVQVAIYHIFENALKYALRGSRLEVIFYDDAPLLVGFHMASLYVDEEDRRRVLDDGHSGKQSRALNKAGRGLGLGLVTDLMKLNGGCLRIEWGNMLPLAAGMPDDSPRYARNAFYLQFA
jgi:K+-sensing histidine kinase KdpD